ncbi:amidase [Roseovarius sp. SCSIO 43702]|uniref:amidase n=1 Tax=Roseovarius sp. SCSIO 43702 TaxID=2823043 RepID=UPI001C73B5F8|nr:amidase [Roseovarius sp. SCSIO 43702]QYX55357.1 amidase [Roseovarius sp. SCSIO 43702]
MSELWAMTAEEMRAAMAAGEVSSVEITRATLARIDAVNPGINAIVDRCDEAALAAAQAADDARAAGHAPGPLAGVPVTVKVLNDQAGHASTNGLRIQKDLIATRDNPFVTNLRRAGAVIVGRTNTPAFSLRWFTRNSLHGHTRNPLNQALTPGGSSGGASAAVAAGMGPVGQGTDIAGSVRYPAYACGIHGLRVSLGRVPSLNFTSGDRHIGAQLMAIAGPLARSIGDLRLAYEAMAVHDPADPWSAPVPLRGPAVPRRAALCLAPDGMDVAPEIRDELRAAARRLEAAGWTVEEVETPPVQEAVRGQLTLWMAEMRRSGGEIVRKEDDPDATLVYERLCRHAPDVDVNGLLDTLQTRARLCREWRAFLETYPVLLCPVSGELPFADLLDLGTEEEFDRIIAAQALQIGIPFMGLPGLTVSTNLVDGPQGRTPVGVQLVATNFREDLLLDGGEVLGGTVAPVG